MADKKPVQHVPVHQRGEGVFDPRHPAASAFAPAQPAAGVVADDVEEKGQNLQGGETASKANETWSDQKEVLAQQHADRLAGDTEPASTEAGGEAKQDVPPPDKPVDKPTAAKPADKK